VTLAEFRAAYPAFNKAPDSLVLAKLAISAAKCDAGAWGDLRDIGIGLWTAHQLTMEPEGREVRISNAQSGTSTYEQQFNQYAAVAGFGPVVV